MSVAVKGIVVGIILALAIAFGGQFGVNASLAQDAPGGEVAQPEETASGVEETPYEIEETPVPEETPVIIETVGSVGEAPTDTDTGGAAGGGGDLAAAPASDAVQPALSALPSTGTGPTTGTANTTTWLLFTALLLIGVGSLGVGLGRRFGTGRR